MGQPLATCDGDKHYASSYVSYENRRRVAVVYDILVWSGRCLDGHVVGRQVNSQGEEKTTAYYTTYGNATHMIPL